MPIFRRIVIVFVYISSQLVPVLFAGTLIVEPKIILGKLENEVTLSCSSESKKTWLKWSIDSTKEQYVTMFQDVTMDFRHYSTSGSYAQPGSFNLILPKLNYTDAGRYQCMDDNKDTQSAELIVMESDLKCDSSCSNHLILLSCIAIYRGNDDILELNFNLDNDEKTNLRRTNSTVKKPNSMSTMEAQVETDLSIQGQQFICSTNSFKTSLKFGSCTAQICDPTDGGLKAEVIGGVAGGILTLLLVVAVVTIYIIWKKTKKKKPTNAKENNNAESTQLCVTDSPKKENEEAPPTDENSPEKENEEAPPTDEKFQKKDNEETQPTYEKISENENENSRQADEIVGENDSLIERKNQENEETDANVLTPCIEKQLDARLGDCG